MAKRAAVATVHILIELTEDPQTAEGEAADALSAFLSECGIYDGAILDWSYLYKDGYYQHAKIIEIPDDYDRDTVDLDGILRAAVHADALANRFEWEV